MTNLTNYPNPFNPETTIFFNLKQDSALELSIFNIKGQKVKMLSKETFSKGTHSIVWNGKDSIGKSVGSGIYFYKISSPGFNLTKKIILLK